MQQEWENQTGIAHRRDPDAEPQRCGICDGYHRQSNCPFIDEDPVALRAEYDLWQIEQAEAAHGW